MPSPLWEHRARRKMIIKINKQKLASTSWEGMARGEQSMVWMEKGAERAAVVPADPNPVEISIVWDFLHKAFSEILVLPRILVMLSPTLHILGTLYFTL